MSMSLGLVSIQQAGGLQALRRTAVDSFEFLDVVNVGAHGDVGHTLQYAFHHHRLLHRWVSEGMGLGWRSTWKIQSQLQRGELVTVLGGYALPAYDILAVDPQQRHLSAKVRLFIEHQKKM
jgi:DNA-binding transcriptional LysR family regulator